MSGHTSLFKAEKLREYSPKTQSFCSVRNTIMTLILKHKYNTLGAIMDRVRAHYTIYDLDVKYNMADFGKKNIPGFKSEMGYGYYEFKVQPEFFKPHKKVILVHKVSLLYELKCTVRSTLSIHNFLLGWKTVYRSRSTVYLYWWRIQEGCNIKKM